MQHGAWVDHTRHGPPMQSPVTMATTVTSQYAHRLFGWAFAWNAEALASPRDSARKGITQGNEVSP
jgi:hypothetical protein